MKPYFQNGLVTIYHGNCLEVLPQLDIKASAIVTDPPYELGFMGKSWDSKGVSFQIETWKTIRESCKSGAMLLSFGGTRTFHRIAVAIEDAGWEYRDTIMWVYGSGFPKSLDISKAIDKQGASEGIAIRDEIAKLIIESGKSNQEIAKVCEVSPALVRFWRLRERNILEPEAEKLRTILNTMIPQEAEREVIGKGMNYGHEEEKDIEQKFGFKADYNITTPSTTEAQLWSGYGTALKPAYEPIIVAMNPIDGTFANNALKHGVAGLNIDECRVEYIGNTDPRTFGGKWKTDKAAHNVYEGGYKGIDQTVSSKGRFPANFIHDGSQYVMELFPNTKSGWSNKDTVKTKKNPIYYGGATEGQTGNHYSDNSGSAARFFYNTGTNDDLLFYRAKAIIEVWNIELANTVDDNSSLSKEHAVSALNHVVTEVSRGVKQLSDLVGLSMNVTPRLLRHLCENAIIMTLSTENEYSPVSCLLSMVNSNGNLARFAEIPKPIDTTMTITSPMNIDGSAVVATLSTTLSNMEHGVKDYPARFRYCAKASKSERNAGCEGLELQAADGMQARHDGSLDGKISYSRNNHPTVKPLALMEYLVKLVKMPEYNLIIDPFCGSGTTLLACIRLGIPCIGIDSDEKSCEIATKRCEYELKI